MRHLFVAQGFQAFLRTIAVVGRALLQHPVDDFLVTREAMRLEKRTFVVFEPKPGHALQDGIHRLGRGAFEVGVLDAQYKGAAVLACIQPGEQRGARPADVQVTGRARAKRVRMVMEAAG